MRAYVELTESEKAAMRTLTGEERDAVIAQMLEHVKEDLEWVLTLEHARMVAAEEPAAVPAPAAAPAPKATATVRARPPATPASAARRFKWPPIPVRQGR
jgi:hypothetical protein